MSERGGTGTLGERNERRGVGTGRERTNVANDVRVLDAVLFTSVSFLKSNFKISPLLNFL
jgi:hypothetical protein